MGLALGWAIPFTIVLLLAALLVQWPILRALRRQKQTVLIFAGSLLAIVPLAAWVGLMLLLFRNDADRETVSGLIRFWLRVPGEFLASFLPMALAGGVLGWFSAEPDTPG